jgi:hypothetical protein
VTNLTYTPPARSTDADTPNILAAEREQPRQRVGLPSGRNRLCEVETLAAACRALHTILSAPCTGPT